MFKLIISQVLWIGSSLGFGHLVSSFIFKKDEDCGLKCAMGQSIFLGLWLMAALSLCLNFFFPISHWISVGSCFCGWVLFLSAFKKEKLFLGANGWQLITICIPLVSVLSVVSYFNIDTGYYHLPTIAVLHKFPVLPGIANVFGPYGHNSSWLALEALFRLPYLGLVSVFSANAVSMVAFVCVLKNVVDKGSVWSLGAIVSTLLLLSHIALGLGGVTPDLPVTLLSLIAWLGFLEHLTSESKEKVVSLPFMLATISFAIAIKLSAIHLVVLLIILVMRRPASFRQATVLRSFVFNGILLFIWSVRSVLNSGCLLFPQRKSCSVSFPWAMPLESVERWFSDVKYHLCGVALKGGIWSDSQCFAEWGKRLMHEPVWKMFLAICSFLVLWQLVNLIKRRKSPVQKYKSDERVLMPLVALFIILVLWFVSAPNLRFLMWWVFAALGLIISFLLARFDQPVSQVAKMFYLFLFIAWGLTLRSAWLTRPFEVHWMDWPTVPKKVTSELFNENGLAVYKPKKGFQCWESSPPCTPEAVQFKINKGIAGRYWFSSVER